MKELCPGVANTIYIKNISEMRKYNAPKTRLKTKPIYELEELGAHAPNFKNKTIYKMDELGRKEQRVNQP